MILQYFMIALGGAIGAVTRVLTVRLFPEILIGIPLKILCVNSIGCFLIGTLTAFISLHGGISDIAKQFLIPGFLGGFTTFSSFAWEFGQLIEGQTYFSALLYIFFSIAIGFSFFFLGVKFIKILS
jgi:CrcB protein